MEIYPRLRNSILLFLLLSIAGCANQQRAHNEALLKQGLYQMRTAIDQYTQDNSKAPQHLSDLVTAHYLTAIPKDPFTNSSATGLKYEKTCR
jgi:hypothetical protein